MKKFLGLLLFAAVSLVSCEKLYNTSKWKPVSFTASGAVSELSADDIVRITCSECTVSGSSQKWADYTVPMGGASLVPLDAPGSELRWGNALHHFYAVYPVSDVAGNVLSGIIPKIQNAESQRLSLYMAAAAEAIRSEQPVDLKFIPLYTTLEFSVSAGESDVVVSGFRLVSEGGALAGGFQAALSAQGDPSVTIGPSTSSEITVSLGSDGSVAVNKGGTLIVTVIALPKDLTNLTAYFIVNGKEKALPLVNQNGVPLVVSGGKKTRIIARDFLTPEQEGFFKISIESQDVDEYDLSY